MLQPEILELIPAGQQVSIERETFPAALAEGWHLYSHPTEGFFADIGTPAGYRRFQEYIKDTGTGTTDTCTCGEVQV